MADIEGNKTGGRVKGTPNKRTQELIVLAKEHKADPFMFLVHVMNGNARALGIGENVGVDYEEDGSERVIPSIDFETRMEAAKELMPYLYSKRKPIDADSDNDDKGQIVINLAYKRGD